MLGLLIKAHHAGRLPFFGNSQHLAVDEPVRLPKRRQIGLEGCPGARRPFAGPKQVLAYLSRYTHRAAISNSRLISADESGVTFKYKD
jgi:hypothetical protein